jgi:hypothetical protein
MYLLLALGITLVVLFAGGAAVGFAAGVADGYNEAVPDTTSPLCMMTYSGAIMVVALCAILHWVFLRWGFAKYSLGRIPREKRWQVAVWLMLAMGGLALLSCVVYNPLAEPDGTPLTEPDRLVRDFYLWMKARPLYSVVLIAFVEATGNLIIYGAVLREILEWRHRPQTIIPIFAAIMALISIVMGNAVLAMVSMVMVLIEAWTYECTRSIIPVIAGDIFYWIVFLLLVGTTFSAWYYFLACMIILPSALLLIKTMDPFKPID